MFLTKVSATFESLQVVLCTRARVLARAKIDNFSAGFSDSAELKRASVSLDGIWVRDLTGAGVLYPYMVECTRGRKLIDINVVMQNKEIYRQSDVADIKSTYLSTRQKPKVDLNGSISGVKVTFLNRFVQELVAYPNAILADMAATAPPPTAVASAAPKTSAPSAKRSVICKRFFILSFFRQTNVAGAAWLLDLVVWVLIFRHTTTAVAGALLRPVGCASKGSAISLRVPTINPS